MKIVIRFRIRTRKKTPKTSPHYIYCRLRINGISARSDIATGVSCLPSEWDNKAQKIRGGTELIREQNAKLEKFRYDLDSIYNDLRRQEKPITAEIIKQAYVNKMDTKPKTLLSFYSEYVNQNNVQIEKESRKQWKSRINMLNEYIQKYVKRKDVDLAEITPKWLHSYYRHHIEALGNSKNHAAKAVSSIKRVLDFAVSEGAIEYNSTKSLKVARDKRKPIKYLSEKQLKQLIECPFFDERLQKVVDCFLFQTYTGMAYNEILHFNPSVHLKEDNKGVTWIMIYRGKTKELSQIPFLSSARNLLEKYNHSLPIITNQKMNDYIKEACRIAGIEAYKEVTTHVGRKTAGMYLLNRGLRLETVSKILGHKSVKITEMYYAELLTDSITDDLKKNGLL